MKNFYVVATFTDIMGKQVGRYSFDFNDPKDRAVFAQQAEAALRAWQTVQTRPTATAD